MAKAKLYSNEGSFKSEVELPSSHFEAPINEGNIHLAVTIYLGNKRQGTAKTKGRSEVSGTGKKPWKQKGTGRARAGSSKSPIWVRGGKAHGATPRDYTRKLNKKVRQQTLRGALSQKAEAQSVYVFEDFNLSEGKTKALKAVLSKAELENKKNLILLSAANENLVLASRNVPNTQVGRIEELNVYDIVRYDNIIFTQESVDTLAAPKATSAEVVA
jgi:large subunit ribosomal protein L4